MPECEEQKPISNRSQSPSSRYSPENNTPVPRFQCAACAIGRLRLSTLKLTNTAALFTNSAMSPDWRLKWPQSRLVQRCPKASYNARNVSSILLRRFELATLFAENTPQIGWCCVEDSWRADQESNHGEQRERKACSDCSRHRGKDHQAADSGPT